MPDQLDKFRVTVLIDMPHTVQAQNVFYCHQEGASTTTDTDFMDACALHLETEWWDIIKTQIDTEVTFDRIQFDEVDFQGKITRAVGVRPIGSPGTSDAQMLPHMDSMLQTMHTLTPKIRGRKYLSGITENKQENGLFDSATLSALAISLAGVLSGFIVTPATQWYYGVISQLAADFVAFTVSGKVTNLLATQRRRRIGRGS